MDVSIIITAYNVERYIKRAIDSALNQQGINLEVIVVDDCSTDGTWGIISSITDTRLKVIKPDRNSGPGAARNAGIAMASGEWIAVLDGDDAFEDGRLSRCISKARQEKADIIVDNLMACREADGAEFLMFPSETLAKIALLDAATFIKGTFKNCHPKRSEGSYATRGSFTAFRMTKNNYTLGYLKPIFSRHFLQQHTLSYDPDLRIGEDYRLMAAALLSGALCVVEPSAGYRYTVRTGSISYRLSLADISRMIKADEELQARYKFDTAAAIAQAGRTKWLHREYAYTQLVNAIKQKDGNSAIKAIVSYPSCLWLLWRPLQVRIKRLVR